MWIFKRRRLRRLCKERLRGFLNNSGKDYRKDFWEFVHTSILNAAEENYELRQQIKYLKAYIRILKNKIRN